MSSAIRGNLERILFIHRRIKQRGIIKTAELVEKFEVDARTVQRDIAYMKRHLEAPIAYSPEHGAYRYTKPFELLNYSDEKTMLLSAFLHDLLKQKAYVPLFSETILAAVERSIGEELLPIAQRISYALPEEELFFSSEILQTVIAAMRNTLIVKISYLDGAGKQSTRKVEPQHIHNYAGKWYLVAYCHKAAALRTFMISRITAATITEELCYQKLEAAEIERYLASGFGIFKAPDTELVTIRFRKPILPMIARQKWHAAQRQKQGRDDSGEFLDLSLPVADYQEILDRVFYYSPYAEALHPAAFRKEWLKRIKQMYEHWCT